MNENEENRFGYLRVLSYDEKLNMIRNLEEDIASLVAIINDKNTSSEQVSELYTDISNEKSQLEYLKSILNEKQL